MEAVKGALSSLRRRDIPICVWKWRISMGLPIESRKWDFPWIQSLDRGRTETTNAGLGIPMGTGLNLCSCTLILPREEADLDGFSMENAIGYKPHNAGKP